MRFDAPPPFSALRSPARIPVADQKRALAFYTEKLGFEGHEGRVGGFQSLTFNCDDVEKTYGELREKGVEFIAPPRKEQWGVMAIFKDSEGNQFVLGQK